MGPQETLRLHGIMTATFGEVRNAAEWAYDRGERGRVGAISVQSWGRKSTVTVSEGVDLALVVGVFICSDGLLRVVKYACSRGW
jgi:hypothetical protein